MTARFTLDEDQARRWLRDATTAYDTGAEPEPDGPELPEISASWRPRDFEEHYNIDAVIRLAADADIITSPGGMDLYFSYEADSDGGYYRFLIGINPYLILTSHGEEMCRIGTPDTEGIAAAMDILREAVQSANGVLDALDEYTRAPASHCH